MVCCHSCYSSLLMYGAIFVLPFAAKLVVWLVGSIIQLARTAERERVLGRLPPTDREGWRGIVGFFHPFCDAGGGGERVLWAAVAETQKEYPNAMCAIYSASQNSVPDLVKHVRGRFNIDVDPARLHIVSLRFCRLLRPEAWPVCTLPGQSIGSAIVAIDGLVKLPPDLFIDTIGFSFSVAASKLLFPAVSTGAYVHYPTISSDMIDRVSRQPATARRRIKIGYWQVFSFVYGLVGAQIDVVVANSSWTKGHLDRQWASHRRPSSAVVAFLNRIFPARVLSDIDVVYPPVAVEELTRAVEISDETERARRPDIVYVSQFRAEKNHAMVIEAMARFINKYRAGTTAGAKPAERLVLVGSTRDSGDEKLVEKLRQLADDLGISNNVDFELNKPWEEIESRLIRSSVGINGMWNEHFGIGVAEYQAAGLIPLVHKSGGPFLDIVVDIDPAAVAEELDMAAELVDEMRQVGSGITGFYAGSVDQKIDQAGDFSDRLKEIFDLTSDQTVVVRKRAQVNSHRFSAAVFARGWKGMMDRLVRPGVAADVKGK